MLRSIRSSFRKRTALIATAAIGVVSSLFFVMPIPAYAASGISEFFKSLIFSIIISPVSALMDFLLYILVEVSQYNGFAEAKIVERGWEVTRDLSNMFFVLILLIIAISSIVKWQKVNYRQNLRQLIMMALLINFSKTIVVFLIDLSQVITLTFISAVKDSLQAGTVVALGLDKMTGPISGGGISEFAGDLFTYVIAAIAFCVATLVVAVILILFLGRIFALWVLLVFAPLAFLASTLPQTKEWYDKWWKQLGSNLTLAPVMAFMLWLVFAVVADNGGQQIQISSNSTNYNAVSTATTDTVIGGIAASSLIGFFVMIGLLIYAIKLGVSMSTVGGSVAQKLASGVQAGATRAGKRIWSGKSGEGGIKGRALTPLSTVAASGARSIGLTRLSENLNIAQAERMEKRQAARRGDMKYMDEATLERRAKGVTTSFTERAELRKEQMRRGAFTAGTDDRGRTRQARTPEEMQKIHQEIEMGRLGRLAGIEGVRGVNQEFIEKEMDVTALPTEGAGRVERFFTGAQSTEELHAQKQRMVNERIRSGKYSDEDLKDRTMQEGLKANKNYRQIADILKDKSQDVIESWGTYIEDQVAELGAREGVDAVNSVDNPEAIKLRRLMSRIKKGNILQASATATVNADGRVVLPASDTITRPDQLAPEFAQTNLKEDLTPSAFAKLNVDQKKLVTSYLDSSKINNFVQDEDVTRSQLDAIFKQKGAEGRAPTLVPPELRAQAVATHRNLYHRSSVFREDYRQANADYEAPPDGEDRGGTTTPGGGGGEGRRRAGFVSPDLGPPAPPPGGGTPPPGGGGGRRGGPAPTPPPGGGGGGTPPGASSIPGREGLWLPYNIAPDDPATAEYIRNGRAVVHNGEVYVRVV